MTATVSIAKAKNRYDTVTKALDLISGDVEKSLKGRKRIVIKPNLVSPSNPVCATHIDAVRATIDFLHRFTSSKITVAEGSAFNTKSCYKNYGYSAITKEYGLELVDLNEDEFVETRVYDRNFNEITIHLAKTMVESDYRVSLAIPKTHDCLIVTLSLKNVVVGSAQQDKNLLHQGYPAMNLNMYKVIKQIPPSLAVIDGWIGMEGNGPVSGTPVELGLALASIDFVAADTVATYLMGFEPSEVGYLTYANGRLGVGDLEKISIVGEDVNPLKKRFKPHQDFEAQRKWHIPPEKLEKLLLGSWEQK